jgi:ATP-dependent DNA helicase DinG
MSLQESVTYAFEANGPLAKYVQNFVPRSGQITMARAVAVAIERGGMLAVEAGTGVGKTYAYLVPALLSGKRILLSTATKTLQDQLFGRDIPRLTTALGLPARVALLKGRSSYLCMHRLGFARQDLRALHPVAQADLAGIERWSMVTLSGDLAELSSLDERSPVIELVTSTRENCQGSKCPQLTNCHVNQARREAITADVVVVNHHLFFADRNIRESGLAELLPTVNAVVFDEAHQLNEIGVQFLGRYLSASQLERYAQDLASCHSNWALMNSEWSTMVMELTNANVELKVLFASVRTGQKQEWFDFHPPGLDARSWTTAMAAVNIALQRAETVLCGLADASPELDRLRQRASNLAAELDVFSQPVQEGWVRWIEMGARMKLMQSPLDIADTMRAMFSVESPMREDTKSWIFTSATLGYDATFSQFLQSCGLQDAQVLQVHSPFDYASQATLYIPADMPKPSDARHSERVAELIVKAASILGGRTLVLTTTIRAMHDIAEKLRQQSPVLHGIEVLVQGETSKRELIERFRGCAYKSNQGFILVATASFWEGVDIPGDALQLVVIDKLPFSPPNDPLVSARSRNLEANGKNPFQYLHMPQAAIALKQGAGRLIRSETDRGILVVCDVRLVQMGYGRRIISALPNMRRIGSETEFVQALTELTKPSTTAR